MTQSSSSSSSLSLVEVAAIVAVIIIWGVNNAAAKVATEVMPPLLVGVFRFAIASACLAYFVRPPYPNWKSLVILALFGGPIHYSLLYLAYWLATDVSPVTVATQLWIPMTSVFAFLILGERMSKLAMFGLVVALAGIAWMTMDAHALMDWKAILVGSIAAAAWGLVTVIARRTRSIPPLKMQGILALTALPTMMLGTVMFETGQIEAIQNAKPVVWWSLIWAGLVSSVLATSVVFWLVQKRETGRITPYLLGAPLVSIFIGWMWMNDTLTPQILTGVGLTLVGVVIVALAERGLRAGAAKG